MINGNMLERVFEKFLFTGDAEEEAESDMLEKLNS